MVVAMLLRGWMPGWQIVFWVVPLGTRRAVPGASRPGKILWYLRTYLWLVPPLPAAAAGVPARSVPVLLLSLPRSWSSSSSGSRRATASGPDWWTWRRTSSAGSWASRTATAYWEIEASRGRRPVVRRALSYGGCVRVRAPGRVRHLRPRRHPARPGPFWSAGFVTLLMYAKTRFGTDSAGLSRLARLSLLRRPRWARGGRPGWSASSTREPSRSTSGTRSRWWAAVPLIDRFWEVPAFEAYLPLDSQWFLLGVVLGPDRGVRAAVRIGWRTSPLRRGRACCPREASPAATIGP
ncbi:hypothetical protein LV779_13285 [Streptomyces thinghirensis]|nr:hypothetical protein [Streptomyces thinghirensis]